MGMYLRFLMTDFFQLNKIRDKEEADFWDLAINDSEEFELNIKSNVLIRSLLPIEHGTKYMNHDDRILYVNFFYHTLWSSYTKEDELLVDKNKYTVTGNDDLGWLDEYKELYWKAYNANTLSKIILDFQKINFDFIKDKYQLSRNEAEQEFVFNNESELLTYRKETENIFLDFKKLTEEMIAIFVECYSSNKDVILCYD